VQQKTTPLPHPRESVNNPMMGCVNIYNGHDARSVEKISVLLSLLLFTTTNTITFLLQPPSMAVATCSLQVKEKPIGRMLASIAPSPVERHQERRSTRLSKSPRTTSVNPLIAELNQTRSRFDNVLETLRSPTTHTMNNLKDAPEEEDPGNMNLPTDKANRISPNQESLSSINLQTPNIGDDTPPQAKVRISEATESVVTDHSPTEPNASPRRKAPTAQPATRQSILQSASYGVRQSPNSSLSDEDDCKNEPQVKEIHDRSNNLFKEYSNDGMKTASYHVTDFAGLYPVWPIIEFLMAPTGNAKDDRMNSFIKCVSALFGKILYIDDTAMIAPISITAEADTYIKSKSDLPTNFTKLRQYIMISGGSWVFNKKAKGSNNVYARFKLKSQVETDKIVN
jgi:hypothetical protein